MKPDNQTILIIGPFPPPVHGFAVITEAMCEQIAALRGVQRFDVSSAAKWKIMRHLHQAQRNLLSLLAIIRHRLVDGCRDVSIGANAGWGLLYTLAQVLLARLIGCRIVTHHHSYKYITVPSLLMKWVVVAGGRAQEHVFLAETMKASFVRIYPGVYKWHILKNAMFVPSGGSESEKDSKAGSITVGMLSNLSEEKGLYEFLVMAKSSKRQGLNLRMVLAGPASTREDEERIRLAEQMEELHWMGPLYGASKYAFFRKLDLFIFPTKYKHEAQPTVIYEAFAAGVPVIASSIGAIADQVARVTPAIAPTEPFAEVALGIINDFTQRGSTGWDELRRRAKSSYESDAAEGRLELKKIYQKRNHS